MRSKGVVKQPEMFVVFFAEWWRLFLYLKGEIVGCCWVGFFQGGCGAVGGLVS